MSHGASKEISLVKWLNGIQLRIFMQSHIFVNIIKSRDLSRLSNIVVFYFGYFIHFCVLFASCEFFRLQISHKCIKHPQSNNYEQRFIYICAISWPRRSFPESYRSRNIFDRWNIVSVYTCWWIVDRILKLPWKLFQKNISKYFSGTY